MPSPVTVKIKVPAFLKKYIIAQSVNKIEPLIFNTNHVYSISLIHKVTNYNSLTCLSLDEKGNVIEYFTPHVPDPTHVIIRLPYSRGKDVRSYNYLSVKNKELFRKEVKDDFYFELSRHIIKQMRKNIQRKEAIDQFFNFYNITYDDLNFESIYRQTTRILKPFYH